MKKLTGTFTDDRGNKYKGELTVEESRRWRAKMGEFFWTTFAGGVSCYRETGSFEDDHLYLIGNYTKTRQESEHNGEIEQACGRLRDAVDAYNGEWKADWEDEDQSKYKIYYNHVSEVFNTGCNVHEEIANAFYLKDNNQTFLKEHEADLRLVWGLVDKK